MPTQAAGPRDCACITQAAGVLSIMGAPAVALRRRPSCPPHGGERALLPWVARGPPRDRDGPAMRVPFRWWCLLSRATRGGRGNEGQRQAIGARLEPAAPADRARQAAVALGANDVGEAPR